MTKNSKFKKDVAVLTVKKYLLLKFLNENLNLQVSYLLINDHESDVKYYLYYGNMLICHLTN